ncbi:MAG: hypothetical protein ACT4QC_11915 [Planctomycetaceae bacterium]
MTPEQLTDKLKAALPEALKCVALFGSAAAGDFVAGASNFNLLLVADPLGPAELKALMPAVADWARVHREPPLFFTPKELASSGDAFPIEFLDIRQSRRVLFGEDLLAGIKIDSQHLRLQLERELKGKLLALRRKYVLTQGGGEAVSELLTGSLSTFLVLFRAALRLYEESVPALKIEALKRLTTHIPFDAQPFLAVESLKERRAGAGDADHAALFAEYLKNIEIVVDAVDRLIHPES